MAFMSSTDMKLCLDMADDNDDRYAMDAVDRVATSHLELRHDTESGDESRESLRPGRFYGPDENWKNYTAEERRVAAALDQAQCNDLALHLYNVHAWKRGLYKATHASSYKSWHSKGHWLSVEKDTDGRSPFVPPPIWTAWPLEPQHVPRRREVWGVPASWPEDDPHTYFKRETWTPSRDLQEELQAIMLRRTKANIQKRGVLEEHAHASMCDSHSSISKFLRSSPAVASSQSHTDSDSSSPGLSDLSDSVGLSEPPFLENNVSAATADGDNPHSEADYREFPPWLLDDDEASAVLSPMLRSMLSQFDRLLSGLHISRNASRNEDKTLAPQQSHLLQTTRDHALNKKKRVALQTVSSRDQTQQNSNGKSGVADSEVEDDNHPRPKKSRYIYIPDQRDWSDVLSMAAMVGWDKAIVDRAAQKSAVLFQESMELRLMPEIVDGRSQDTVISYMPDGRKRRSRGGALLSDQIIADVPNDETLTEREEVRRTSKACETSATSGQEDQSGKPSFAKYACPDESCFHHTQPYENRWALRQHLGRTHKRPHDEAQAVIDAIDGLAPKTAASTKGTVLRASRRNDRTDGNPLGSFACPHGSCVRRPNPYKDRWALRQHLKRTHGHADKEVEEMISVINENGDPFAAEAGRNVLRPVRLTERKRRRASSTKAFDGHVGDAK